LFPVQHLVNEAFYSIKQSTKNRHIETVGSLRVNLNAEGNTPVLNAYADMNHGSTAFAIIVLRRSRICIARAQLSISSDSYIALVRQSKHTVTVCF
jgi:hypothetical protein